MEPCLACYAVPSAHRVRVRIFPHRAALLRLVTALALEQSECVSGRRYLSMEPLEEGPRAATTPVAQAASHYDRRSLLLIF